MWYEYLIVGACCVASLACIFRLAEEFKKHPFKLRYEKSNNAVQWRMDLYLDERDLRR